MPRQETAAAKTLRLMGEEAIARATMIRAILDYCTIASQIPDKERHDLALYRPDLEEFVETGKVLGNVGVNPQQMNELGKCIRRPFSHEEIRRTAKALGRDLRGSSSLLTMMAQSLLRTP